MMEYKVDSSTYGFSYTECKESYLLYCSKTDREFLNDLSGALHLAVFICYIKEIPSDVCLRDDGIIHELAHLLHIKDYDNKYKIKSIRKLFKEMLQLS